MVLFLVHCLPVALGQIAVFDFQEAWQGAKELDFPTFAGNAGSLDSDEGSVASEFIITDSILSLTWKSSPGKSYAVRYSTGLENWDREFEDGILAEAGETTSREVNLETLAVDQESRHFVRVEEE